MKETDIKILLERFYEGTTTLEEEKILSEFLLQNDNISPVFEPDKKLFKALNGINEQTPSQEFENNIESFIDNLDNQSRKTVPIWSIGWKKTASIAAAVIVMIASGISYNNYETRQKNAMSLSQEQVYNEAERALVLLSQNLNKGVSKVDIAEKQVDKVNEILNKQFQ